MELSEIILLLGISVIFLVGIIGVIIPIIPTLPIIWGGIVLFGFIHGFDPELQKILLWTGIIALVGAILDVFIGAVGARTYGASAIGVVGAFIGGIIGFLIFSLFGLIVGSFLGTLLFEYLRGTDREKSLRAAWGTLIGFLWGTLIKLSLAIVMIVAFVQYIF